MQLVQILEEIQHDDFENHGGKAVNLARLVQLGFQVPNGLSISSAAFVHMVRKNQNLTGFLREVDESDDFEEILEISGSIQQIIGDYQIPESMISEISENLNQLERAEFGFAVRSSATIEDRRDVSFAGQAESFLCVKREEDIIESVKKVWQSAFSERALIYLKSKEIPLKEVKMAVLVQEMIPAEISGVMFTANVVTNNPGEILINSTWGLGNTLVSGEIVPDTYVLKKKPLSVIEQSLGEKEFTSRLELYELVLDDTPEEKRSQYSLDERTLFDIAEVGMKIEEWMEFPQDIEWCIKPDGILVILQSRPITTLNVPSSHEE
ncbi:MAG: PEP/pyruvate-binding domain-containing protein [Candidatus Thorarchaeota archaeon]